MKRRIIILAITAIAMYGALAGCVVGSCTEIGCLDNLTVRLTQISGTLADGTYSVAMRDNSNSAVETCDFTMADGQISGDTTCPTWSDDAVSVSFSSVLPTTATLTVTRNANEVATQDITINYTESRPNGESCGPMCFAATVDFEVAPVTSPSGS